MNGMLRMTKLKMIDVLWLLMLIITLISALLAESAEPGFWVTLTMCFAITFKGHMIVDRFMELRNANQTIRNLMNVYFYVLPAMIMLVYLFPESIAKLTTL